MRFVFGQASGEAQADTAVAVVRALYARALQALEPSWYTYDTEAKKNAHAMLLKRKAVVDDWATTRRAWARAGVTPTGLAYTWGNWAAFGKVLESEFLLYLNESSKVDLWTGILKPTLVSTVEDVAVVVKKGTEGIAKLVPWVAVIAAAYALGPILRGLGKRREA